MINENQILKGLMERCILKIVEKEEIYGPQTAERLNEIGFDVTQTKVYPILIRLTNEGILKAEKKPSPRGNGSKRKYYYLTEQGKNCLQGVDTTWESIQNIMIGLCLFPRDDF